MIGAAVDSATADTTAVNIARARAAVDSYERNAASDIIATAHCQSNFLKTTR